MERKQHTWNSLSAQTGNLWVTRGFPKSKEWSADDMDSDDLRPLLASFKFLKAQYRHMENEAEFFYESLRPLLSPDPLKLVNLQTLSRHKRRSLPGLGQETAEKQLPSALEFVGQFRKAVEAHSATLGKRLPLSQALNTCIGEYNKRATVKRWRVDAHKRKIISNMLRCPAEVSTAIANHYDLHKHSMSGAPTLLAHVHAYDADCATAVSKILFEVPLESSWLAQTQPTADLSLLQFSGKEIRLPP